jgi:hypothetical protein
MANYIPRNSGEKNRRLVAEHLLIHDRFPFLTTRLVGNKLICRGRVQPTATSETYRVEVSYEPWNAPEVRILEPDIKAEGKLHFHKDGTLCLYDWREQPWKKQLRLADTVIPWVAEWLLFYEIYLLTGKWIGASAVHGAAKVEEPKPDSQRPEKVRVE